MYDFFEEIDIDGHIVKKGSRIVKSDGMNYVTGPGINGGEGGNGGGEGSKNHVKFY